MTFLHPENAKYYHYGNIQGARRLNACHIQMIGENDFQGMGDEWDALLSSSANNNVFLTWEWLFTWWRHFQKPDCELRVVCARDDLGQLKGILPLYQEFNGHSQSGGTLRFLGTGAACSEYLDLIVEKGYEGEIVCNLLQYVFEKWDTCSFELTDIPFGSGNFKHLECTLQELKVPFFVGDLEICPFMELPDTVDGFYKKLKPNMRSNYKRAIKKFQERFGKMPRRLEGRERLQSAYDALFTLHRARFDNKGERSSFLSDEMRGFHLDVGNMFLEKGWLRFYSLEVGDTPVGSLYCFAYGKGAYRRLGHDQQFCPAYL